MRGSRKRDRRPPSRLWSCGTRPAKLHRWRAILMAFNTPFAICASSDSMTWTTCDGRHGSASTRRAPSAAWPCTSDLLPITPYCMWQRVHASGPINCLALHVRPSAGYFCGYCYGPYGRLAARPRVGPHQLPGPTRPTFCRSLLLSTLVRAARRDAGISCAALVDPFLAMSETLAPTATNVYPSHYRFSIPGAAVSSDRPMARSFWRGRNVDVQCSAADPARLPQGRQGHGGQRDLERGSPRSVAHCGADHAGGHLAGEAPDPERPEGPL